jgi:hypothetical protein
VDEQPLDYATDDEAQYYYILGFKAATRSKYLHLVVAYILGSATTWAAIAWVMK